ncbi:ester cyclase [Rhizobium sp. GR12]|uniref:ester cyclase n=1 Tax=Rhizobium sp. GR12 TaxID=3053925 RepID=UPI002FBE7FF3
MPTLKDIYLDYLDCLNRQAFDELATFVDDNIEHNGRPFGLSGYRDMLARDFAAIPDLRFDAQILVSDGPRITPARLVVAIRARRIRSCDLEKGIKCFLLDKNVCLHAMAEL